MRTSFVVVAVLTAALGQARAADLFVKLSPGDAVISKVPGISVENPADQHLGSIRQIAYMGADVKAYIFEAGGHWVAVSPLLVTFKYDVGAKTWHALMNAEPAQIKAAPSFAPDSED